LRPSILVDGTRQQLSVIAGNLLLKMLAA